MDNLGIIDTLTLCCVGQVLWEADWEGDVRAVRLLGCTCGIHTCGGKKDVGLDRGNVWTVALETSSSSHTEAFVKLPPPPLTSHEMRITWEKRGLSPVESESWRTTQQRASDDQHSQQLRECGLWSRSGKSGWPITTSTTTQWRWLSFSFIQIWFFPEIYRVKSSQRLTFFFHIMPTLCLFNLLVFIGYFIFCVGMWNETFSC